MNQLRERNRKGEDQYSVEYMQELNKKYDILEKELYNYPIKHLYYIQS